MNFSSLELYYAMKKIFDLKILPLLLVILVGACSSNHQITYNIEEDPETGILYNTDWKKHLDAENAYYNNTNGLVNVRAEQSNTGEVIAYVKPNEGGFIKNCNFDLQYCLINFGGKPETGWVNMAYLKEGEIEYKR